MNYAPRHTTSTKLDHITRRKCVSSRLNWGLAKTQLQAKPELAMRSILSAPRTYITAISGCKMAGREISVSVAQCLHYQRYNAVRRRYQKHPCSNWPHYWLHPVSICTVRKGSAWRVYSSNWKPWRICSCNLTNTTQLFQLNDALYERIEDVRILSPLGSKLIKTRLPIGRVVYPTRHNLRLTD